MAIATALRGFNDLGHSVTPIKQILFRMIYTLSKNEQKLKLIQDSVQRALNSAILRPQSA